MTLNSPLEVNNMESIEIKSGSTAASLKFYNRNGEYFDVIYESPSVKLMKRVWGYTDCKYLVSLFKFMAKEWKGWEGCQEWVSIEGEFGITATSDNLGHIVLALTFKEFDAQEAWEANVRLCIDSGQTEKIAKQVGSFFAA
jgi:hypothetical protein